MTLSKSNSLIVRCSVCTFNETQQNQGKRWSVKLSAATRKLKRLQRTVEGLYATWMWNSPGPLEARNHWSVGLLVSKEGANLRECERSSQYRSPFARTSTRPSSPAPQG